jgi:hypothetical protein
MLKFLAAATIFSALALSSAHAATLSGDSVSVQLTIPGFPPATDTVTVGAGADAFFFGTELAIDFNAGVNGDLFTLTSSADFPDGFFTGPGNADFLLSSLDFGTPLTGFNIIQNFGSGVVDSLTDTSVAFSVVGNNPISRGTFFTAQFITTPVSVAVPLPGTLSLFAAGLASLGVIGWRIRLSGYVNVLDGPHLAHSISTASRG